MGETAAGDRDAFAISGTESDPLGAAEETLVTEWIRPALGEIAVAFGPIAAEPGSESAPEIHLTLLGITPAATARASSRDPPSLLLRARFLVTASAPDQSAADRLIVALGFAALDRGVPELERDGPAIDLWHALGVEARPALVVREMLERHRPVHAAPLVRRPVVTQWSHTRTISGRVSGPGEVPIAGARIEVVNAGLTTYSDHRGDFVLLGVPVGPPAPVLVVTAKGVRLKVRAKSPSSKPLVISVPLPES